MSNEAVVLKLKNVKTKIILSKIKSTWEGDSVRDCEYRGSRNLERNWNTKPLKRERLEMLK